ncbi:hypothetical protein GCM10009583_16760 [Ornithinicoccus hortensis]
MTGDDIQAAVDASRRNLCLRSRFAHLAGEDLPAYASALEERYAEQKTLWVRSILEAARDRRGGDPSHVPLGIAPPGPLTEKEILTWDLFGTACRELAQQVADSGFEPEILIAVARGGLLPGGGLSYA